MEGGTEPPNLTAIEILSREDAAAVVAGHARFCGWEHSCLALERRGVPSLSAAVELVPKRAKSKPSEGTADARQGCG